MAIRTPTPMVHQARHVVLHPELAVSPRLRALSWHILATDRGTRTDLQRITAMAEQAAGAPVVSLEVAR